MDKTSLGDGPSMIKSCLYKESFTGEGSISEYIAKILNYREQLAHTPFPLTDQDTISHIITNLSNSWKTIRTIISNQPVKVRTLNFTINSLINYERELQEEVKEGPNPVTNALFARSGTQQRRKPWANNTWNSGPKGQGSGEKGSKNSKEGGGSRITKSNPYESKNRTSCWYCLKPGHKESECRTKKKAMDNRRQRDTQKHSHTNSDESEANLAVVRALMATTTPLPQPGDWYVDSGATNHICSTQDQLSDLRDLPTPIQIKMGNNSEILATRMGTLNLQLPECSLALLDVLVAPGIQHNLISVSQLNKRGKGVIFLQNKCSILDATGHPLAIAHAKDGLYKLQNLVPVANLAEVKPKPLSLELWHQRLGHLNPPTVQQLIHHANGIALDTKGTQLESICKPCLEGKQHRSFNKVPVPRKLEKLELIHSDSCGPFSTPSNGGMKYFIVFIDDYSRMTWVYFLKTKSSIEINKIFRDFKALVENQTGLHIKRFRCDNGKGEYDNHTFRDFLSQSGISYEPSAPYTQHQNGVSERKIRTLVEKARSMLCDSQLGLSYWAEAISTAAYLCNRSPTRSLEGKTPFEAWYGSKPDLHHLKRFGCDAYLHLPPSKRTKLESKTRCCTMLGYVNNTTKQWRVWDPVERRVTNAADIVFDEKSNTAATHFHQKTLRTLQINADQDSSNLLRQGKVVSDQFAAPDEDSNPVDLIPTETSTSPIVQEDTIEAQPPRYNLRGHKVLSAQAAQETVVPTSYWEAVESVEKRRWQEAINEEYTSLQKNSTWSLTELPPGRKAIPCKWIFKRKINSQGEVRFKARLVIKGYEQKQGIDYDETFAPVAMLKTIRILLAISALEDWEIHQMDVKSAFLNPVLEEEVYMMQPEGFEQGHLVCKLQKALYGLKQAPRAWYNDINGYMQSIGFQNSTSDPNLYLSPKVILLLFVDDALIFSNGMESLDAVKHLLAQKYQMSDLGEAQQFLGIEIHRNRASKTLHISQSQYIKTLLQKFQMDKCNGIATPLDRNDFLPYDSEAPAEDRQNYQSVVGSIMHAMIGTRPDLAYTASTLSKFCSNPSPDHLGASKRSLRYLNETLDYGITLGGEKESTICIWADSSWASDLDTRKSTHGYLIKIAGGAVSWKSKRQNVVALSSTEAEYICYSEAAKEAIWLRRLLAEIDLRKPLDGTNEAQSKWGTSPMIIFGDSQSAIDLSNNPRHHERTKHIDIKHHFIREAINKGLVSIVKVSSAEEVADALTKPLGKQKFELFRSQMGMERLEKRIQG